MSISQVPSNYAGNFVDWGTVIDDKGTWKTLSGGENGEWKYLLDHYWSSSKISTDTAAYVHFELDENENVVIHDELGRITGCSVRKTRVIPMLVCLLLHNKKISHTFAHIVIQILLL